VRKRKGFRKNKIKKKREDIWVYSGGEYVKEKVPAERWMRLIYETPVGAPLLHLVKRKVVSRMYGAYCRSRHSARIIPKFVADYDVDMSGCEAEYKNFAEFFSRSRSDVAFPENSAVLGSPCEGLISAYSDIDPNGVFTAKGAGFSLAELFGDADLAREFAGGSMLHMRLTPADYHRIHFFDNGRVIDSKLVNGHLFSVSPIALSRIARLYCHNKRALIRKSCENFGEVVLVEVGATFVGSIVHCFKDGEDVRRGDEAAFFLPGGSLLLAFFRAGSFAPSPEIITRTQSGIETRINLGEPIGFALNK